MGERPAEPFLVRTAGPELTMSVVPAARGLGPKTLRLLSNLTEPAAPGIARMISNAPTRGEHQPPDMGDAMTDVAPDTGTDATTTTTAVEVTETTDTDAADLAAEVEKWKAQARKHEDRAKANAAAAKELEQFKQASMSDQEKAVELARTQARTEALMEVATERVDDAVKLAAAGRPVDVEALLDGLDRTRFVTDEGKPDIDAINAWVDRIAPKPTEDDGFTADLGQGARVSAAALNGDPLLRTLKGTLGIR